jgi:integrase/recombinase XerC
MKKKKFEKPLGRFRLAADLDQPGELPLRDAFARVKADWERQAADGLVTDDVVYTYCSVMSLFVDYAEGRGLEHLYDVTPTIVLEWMHSATAKGEQPANSTRLQRRSMARTFFGTAQKLGLYDENPAQSVVEHRRTERHVHAFTDAEIAQLKRTATYRIGEVKAPTMLALMLLGATSREVAYIRVGDVDLKHRRVWLHGGADRNRPRWVPIEDDWAANVLRERIAAICKARPEADWDELAKVLLTYRPKKGDDNPAKRAASVATTLDRLLRTARVYVAGETRLESIREWLALRVFQQTGRLEDVAVRLGLSSLDTIAHVVGSEWVDEHTIKEPPPAVDGEDW